MSVLLASDEPPPVGVARAVAPSPFFLTCDHAGRRIPRALGDLGLPARERARHIGWDIGALGVARALAARLAATLVWQRYSRLVIDCNRPLDSPDLICTRSEATVIRGNLNLTGEDRRARIDAVYEPYHDTIRTLLDARAAAGRRTIYVAVHTFTPVYLGVERPWHVGVLHGADARLAGPVLERLREAPELTVGDNEPYRIDDKDQGIPVHGLARGLPHVLFEIRQDLLATKSAQADWGMRLAAVLLAASSGL